MVEEKIMRNCTGYRCWHTSKDAARKKGKPSKHIGFVAAGCLGTDACRLSETGQRGKSYVMRTALT